MSLQTIHFIEDTESKIPLICSGPRNMFFCIKFWQTKIVYYVKSIWSLLIKPPDSKLFPVSLVSYNATFKSSHKTETGNDL